MTASRGLRRRLREIRKRSASTVGPSDPLRGGSHGVGAGEMAGDGPGNIAVDLTAAAHGVAFTVDETIDVAGAGPDLFAPGFRADPTAPEANQLIFFDLETSGLGLGTRIFMAGYLFWDGPRLRLVQEVAGDVAEERWLVASALTRLARRRRVVTFNGASYDLPLLRRRARFHGLEEPLGLDPVDLLHSARRRFKKRLPNCRLATLERQVIGKRRGTEDIPGAEAPLRFLDYARDRDRRHIDPVLYHNRIDLTTLAALYPLLTTEEPDAPSEVESVVENPE